MSEYRKYTIKQRLDGLKRIKKWVGQNRDVNTCEIMNYVLMLEGKIRRLEGELDDLRKS